MAKVILFFLLMAIAGHVSAGQCVATTTLLREDIGQGPALTQEMKMITDGHKLSREYQSWKPCFDAALKEAGKLGEYTVFDTLHKKWYVAIKWKFIQDNKPVAYGFLNKYSALYLKRQKVTGSILLDVVGAPVEINEVIEELVHQVPEMI